MDYFKPFKEILSENLEKEGVKSPTLIRFVEMSFIPHKASIFTGVRRSGKSTLVEQFKNKLAEKGRKSLTLNFIDERIKGCHSKDLSSILPAFFELNGECEKIDFFLDEIQVVEGWEYWVDRLIRNPSYRVFITGSNSKMLSSEIGTAMRGRSLSTEVFPFSFKEFCEWKDIKIGETPGKKATLLNEFNKYLMTGGFPEVIKLKDKERTQILQEYRETMIFRDLIERHQCDPVMTNRCVQLLLGQFSSMVTINKTVEKLKSQGFKASKENISHLFQWLTEPYLFFFIPLFSESIQKQNVNPKKIYAIDTGLVVANYGGVSKNTGRLLENGIFLHLRRNSKKIFYWKDENGNEVDFIVNENELIQVCESLENEETKERELKGLRSAMKFFKIKKSKIITLNEEEEIKTPEGKIQVIPAWRFLLLDQ